MNIAAFEDRRRFPVDVDGRSYSVYQDHLLSQVVKTAGEWAKEAMAFRIYLDDKTRVIVRVGTKELFRDIADAKYREESLERMMEVDAVKELMGELAEA